MAIRVGINGLSRINRDELLERFREGAHGHLKGILAVPMRRSFRLI